MTVMLIDGNSLGFAAQSAAPLTVNGMEVQAVYHSLKTLRGLLFNYAQYGRKIYWLWDSRAQWRYDIHPEYKGKRDANIVQVDAKIAYTHVKPYLENALTHLGVTQLWSDGFEADDLAGCLSRQLSARSVKTLLVTGDQDWLQLVNEHVSWMDARDRSARFCDHKRFKEYTGFGNAHQFVQAKALRGDVSDNIQGVGGLGDKAAKEIMEHFGSIEALRELHQSKTGLTKDDLPESMSRFVKPVNALFTDNWATFERNMALMCLTDARHDASIVRNLKRIEGQYNAAAFARLCIELQFNSILQTLERWLEPFHINGRQAA